MRSGGSSVGLGVPGLRRLAGLVLFSVLMGGRTAYGQVLGGEVNSAAPVVNPLLDTTVKPGKALLFDLEAKFAEAVAQGGGKAFASWFAEDGISMGNGQAPVHGREAIAKQATWLAKDYQLVWTPTEATMGPSGDMGYTWGHYEGRSKDVDGSAKVTTGRYLTIWRREADGSWKVLMDSSSEEPAGAGECCRVTPGS